MKGLGLILSPDQFSAPRCILLLTPLARHTTPNYHHHQCKLHAIRYLEVKVTGTEINVQVLCLKFVLKDVFIFLMSG